ncbi:gp53-like domain-containing protein [Escherichia coli]|uniref:gp53-like domain-containing protein n=1 Tax=Escherichia coli TaxID=562 RepID=UPI002576EDBA|nr:hypothetical protein [Escherichia coli]
MLRIGQVEATATQDGKYTDGSVAGGIAATRLRAAAFNAMQEELAHIVESAGLALDINDMTQVLKAIQKLTLSRANPFADIKSDGAAAISTALTNLHLEETVKQAAGAMQKSANGGDIQNVAAFRNALQLGTAALASMGVGKNQVLSASDFSFFAGGNGYLYIPCLATTDNPVKIMLQWGTIQARGGENNIYNLPYAFPTAGLWAMGCRAANGYSQSMNVSIENRSQIRIQNWAPAGAVESCCFFAVGYL